MTSYWSKVTSERWTRRRAIAGATGLGAGALALSLVGCGGGDDGAGGVKLAPGEIPYSFQIPDETKDALRGGMYRSFRTSDLTGGYDPYTTSSRSTTLTLVNEVYQVLLQLNSGPGIDNRELKNQEYQGLLAESYEITDGGTTYIFKMRPNVYFHDISPVNGRVMDIEDWKVSIERLRAGPYRVTMETVFDMDKTTFPDSRTMVMKLNEPYAPGVSLFAYGGSSFWVMPKEAGGKMDATTQAIGTDYKQLESHQPSVGFRFKRHDRFWIKERPFLDRYDYPIIPEKANRYAQFVTKNIHFYTPLPEDLIQMRKDVPDALMQRADATGGVTLSYFGLKDFEASPWRDERVRQAMSMVIDRKSRFEYLRNHAELLANEIDQRLKYHTHFGAATIFWQDWTKDELGDESKYFKFAVAEAKKLMTAAGLANGIDIETYAHTGTNYGAQYHESADIFNDMLQKSGLFRVKYNRPQYADFLPNIYQKRDYSGLAIVHPGFAGGSGDNDSAIYSQYHSGSGQLFRGIKDSTLEAMIEKQRRELDVKKRESIMHDIQKLLAKKQYVITTEGVYDTFTFRWPFLRNTAWPSHSWWLTQDTPNRNG